MSVVCAFDCRMGELSVQHVAVLNHTLIDKSERVPRKTSKKRKRTIPACLHPSAMAGNGQAGGEGHCKVSIDSLILKQVVNSTECAGSQNCVRQIKN